MTKRCCGTSVGVLLVDEHGRVLMIRRATAPSGIAPVAGHAADEGQPSFQAAAVAEVREEVGLTVSEEDLGPVVYWRHLGNLCRRIPADPPGHQWAVFRTARWTGELAPSQRETHGAAWYTPADIQVLAERTVAYARGDVSEQAWTAEPGLEPVWVWMLQELGLVRADAPELLRVLAIAETPTSADPRP